MKLKKAYKPIIFKCECTSSHDGENVNIKVEYDKEEMCGFLWNYVLHDLIDDKQETCDEHIWYDDYMLARDTIRRMIRAPCSFNKVLKPTRHKTTCCKTKIRSYMCII